MSHPIHPYGNSRPGAFTVRWGRPGYALGLALLVVAPLLKPGYLLLRDGVSTPRSYLSDTALGLTSAPRATPQDFAVALASHVLDGGIVVKTLLVLGLWLAGWGAARLVATALPCAGAAGQFVATTLAIWNPYVAERLLQGHWSLLVGYGCLPWVATAMLTLRTASRSGRRGLRAGLLDGAGRADPDRACCSPRRWRWSAWRRPAPDGRAGCARAAASFAALVAALPWLTAAALGSSLTVHTAANTLGVNAFAPRAEPGLGTLASLASLGGIWNGEAVPGFADNAFRGVVRRSAAGGGARRDAGGGTPCGGGAAAGAGGGVSAGDRRRWRPGRVCMCCGRWLTPRRAWVCCATGKSGWRWRCRDTRWRAPAPWSRCDGGCGRR